MIPKVITVKMVGFNCGIVTFHIRCHSFVPSMMAASSVDSPMLCRAAMNMSMKVPEVVKTTMRMMANMATEGPESQSHQEIPRKPWAVRG